MPSCFCIFYDDPTLSDITMSKAGVIRRKAFNSTVDHLLERYLKTRWIHSIFLISLGYVTLPLLTTLSITNVVINPSIATKVSLAFAVIILLVWLAFNIYACLHHSNRENSVSQIELTQEPPKWLSIVVNYALAEISVSLLLALNGIDVTYSELSGGNIFCLLLNCWFYGQLKLLS